MPYGLYKGVIDNYLAEVVGMSGFDKGALDAAFAACGIAPTARAETLAPERFVELAAALG